MPRREASGIARSALLKIAKFRHDLHFYLLAVATVALAAFLRWLLGDFLGPTAYPFFLFNLAVVICSWYGTLGSSLFCSFLGGMTADYLFVDPKHTIGPSNLHGWIAMITYLVVSISIAIFAEGHRRAIARSEKTGSRLKLALSVASASTFDWNPRSNTFTWSDSYYDLFGIPRAEPPTLENWLAHIHRQDRERVMQSLMQIVGSRQEQAMLDFRLIGAGGRQHWVHARLAALRGDGPGELRVIGAKIDVSELKQAEAALLRSEKLASAGKLAATVAHEINNPLAAATNLLFLAMESPLSEDVKSHLEAADRQLARVAAVARRTLAFYKEPSNPAAVILDEVLANAAQQLSHKIAAKKITLETRYGKGLLISGVAGELGQAFSNLVANSADAAPLQGKISIRAFRLRNGRDPASEMVRVFIADNGAGIKAADRELLFEPFFSTKGPAGTGLGLWVSKGIIRRHAGRIRIRSRAEGNRTGTVVCVTLPALAAADAESLSACAAAWPCRPSTTIPLPPTSTPAGPFAGRTD